MTVTGEQSLSPCPYPNSQALGLFSLPYSAEECSDRAVLLGTGVQPESTHHTSFNTLGSDTHKLFKCVQQLTETHTSAPLLFS